jgi:hypothetical protein
MFIEKDKSELHCIIGIGYCVTCIIGTGYCVTCLSRRKICTIVQDLMLEDPPSPDQI